MGNATIQFVRWEINCREKKRTENMLYYVAVVQPNFQTTLTRITFPPGWIYREREKLTSPPPRSPEEAAEMGGGKESARKRLREKYVQDYKRKREAWVAAAPPPSPSMEEEAEEGEEEYGEEEKQEAAAAERVQQASRKRRREFQMRAEEDDEGKIPKPQKELDAADTICRPFFRLLYEDTSLDFDHALEQVIGSDRLLFYRYGKWRIVLYIIDHTLPLQVKNNHFFFEGSGLADLFRPERPFNPDIVAEMTRFINDEDAQSIVGDHTNDPAVVNITSVLAKELQESYTELYNNLRERGVRDIVQEGEKIKSMTRGHFVDLHIQNLRRNDRQQGKKKKKKRREEEANPWENESVWFAMQHAAAEIQLRAHDTETVVSPMLVFHLMCASVIEKTLFNNNLNVWFNEILPHIKEIDTSIRKKFQDSTSPLAQPMEDVNFVLCLLSYLSHFQLTENTLQFTSIFGQFNSQENGRFDMKFTRNSLFPFIAIAAQSVNRNSIIMSNERTIFVIDKASPRDKIHYKPSCIGVGKNEEDEEVGNGCKTLWYKPVAMLLFGRVETDRLIDISFLLDRDLNQAMGSFSPNKKSERTCDMAAIQLVPYDGLYTHFYAPSPWQDLNYFLSQLARDCNVDLIADIVSTAQGIPYQVIQKLLNAPSVFSEEEEEEKKEKESEDMKKRNAAIRDVARGYLYSQAQKPQEKRLDPFMRRGIFKTLCTVKANDTPNAIELPSLEEAISLLQIA